MLRCISRFELLSQMANGGITDMALFAPPTPEPASPGGFWKGRRGLFGGSKPAEGMLLCISCLHWHGFFRLGDERASQSRTNLL